jgi:hypothetical protein
MRHRATHKPIHRSTKLSHNARPSIGDYETECSTRSQTRVRITQKMTSMKSLSGDTLTPPIKGKRMIGKYMILANTSNSQPSGRRRHNARVALLASRSRRVQLWSFLAEAKQRSRRNIPAAAPRKVNLTGLSIRTSKAAIATRSTVMLCINVSCLVDSILCSIPYILSPTLLNVRAANRSNRRKMEQSEQEIFQNKKLEVNFTWSG